MNNQWLRSFILSTDCGSFSKAAKASFISTTALVQQMNLFEKEIGFRVFIRSNNGLRLTEAGADFYQTAKEILRIYEEGRKRAYEIAQNTKSFMRFAFEPYQFPDKWLTVLNDFHNKNQNIQMQMVPVNMKEQINAILEDRADVCILAEPKEEYLGELKYMNIYQDTYSFCMQKGHPLAHKEILTLEDMQEYVIICGNYPYMREKFEDRLKDAPFVKTIPTEYDMTTRFSIPKDDLFVIHSAWKDQYTSFFSVVKTNISAGNVGLIYYKKYEEQARKLCSFFQQKEYEEFFI